MSPSPTEPHSSDRQADGDGAGDDPGAEVDRSTNRMLLTMVVCCAAIPLALVAAAIVNGSTFGSVNPLGWAILAAAFAAAVAFAVRMGRSRQAP